MLSTLLLWRICLLSLNQDNYIHWTIHFAFEKEPAGFETYKANDIYFAFKQFMWKIQPPFNACRVYSVKKHSIFLPKKQRRNYYRVCSVGGTQEGEPGFQGGGDSLWPRLRGYVPRSVPSGTCGANRKDLEHLVHFMNECAVTVLSSFLIIFFSMFDL